MLGFLGRRKREREAMLAFLNEAKQASYYESMNEVDAIKRILRADYSHIAFDKYSHRIGVEWYFKDVEFISSDEKLFDGEKDDGWYNPLYDTIAIKEKNIENLSTIAHEDWHEGNHRGGKYKELPMRLSEVFKAGYHNEISANIVALLQVRQQWLGAKSDSERSEIEKIDPLFDFYFEALKEGRITTDHKTVQDFDEEMRCITEGVQAFWCLHLINDYYEQIIENVRDYFMVNDYDNIASNISYYDMYCENAYRIGGLDFRKYGLEYIDILLASTGMEYADKLVKAGVDRKSIHDFFDTLLVDKDKAYQKASELEKKERQTDENLQREGVFVQFNTELLLIEYDNHESINLYKSEIIDFRSDILLDLRDALIKKENFEKEQMLLNEKKIKKGVNLRKKLSESDFFQKIKVIRKIKEKRRADGLKEIHPSKKKQKNNIRLYRNQGKGE